MVQLSRRPNPQASLLKPYMLPLSPWLETNCTGMNLGQVNQMTTRPSQSSAHLSMAQPPSAARMQPPAQAPIGMGWLSRQTKSPSEEISLGPSIMLGISSAEYPIRKGELAEHHGFGITARAGLKFTQLDEAAMAVVLHVLTICCHGQGYKGNSSHQHRFEFDCEHAGGSGNRRRQ